MNTKITVTLNPTEFDLLRESVEFNATNEEHVMNDRSTDHAIRAASRAKAAQLRDLQAKLNS